jgi:hypothetical protein
MPGIVQVCLDAFLLLPTARLKLVPEGWYESSGRKPFPL